MRWLDGITNSMDIFGKVQEIVKGRETWLLQSMELQGVEHYLVTEQQQ